jgi:hypothetical protein
VVEALRDALLDRHELIGEEILEVIRAAAVGSTNGDSHVDGPGVGLF